MAMDGVMGGCEMAAREWSVMRAGDDTDWVIIDDTEYDPDVVCTVHQTNEHSSFTAEDNARLIAAAPDMLAALEAITDQLERIGNSRDVPFIALALVAIAKAKGA